MNIKKHILFLLLICSQILTTAQQVRITSIDQKGQKIYITYNLSGKAGKHYVKIFVKSSNSYSWSSPLKSVSGDVGHGQTIGNNKQIVWDVLQDRDKFVGDWVFGIEATNVTEKNRIADEIERKKKQMSDAKAKKLKKENNLARQQRKMHPKSQIGYITNFTAHPVGGINYFNYSFLKAVGFYIDLRPTVSFLYRDNHTSIGNSYNWPIVSSGHILWTSVFNGGFSLRLYNDHSKAVMIYAGLGVARTKIYDRADVGFYYASDYALSNSNINFGILLQTDAKISWQLGIDNAVRKIYNTPGLNIGIGIRID